MGEIVQTETNQGMLDVAMSRQAQEVQAAAVLAKKFPRDERAAFTRIMKACGRPRLAHAACYAYPKGDKTVSGPSIRMAEVLAQGWGNIDFGIIELEQKAGESIMMSYAWDLETNTRSCKVFTVPHIRTSKTYGSKRLTDPRDIYEMTANQGARRLRACILGIIPGDIVDEAIAACEKTLVSEAGDEPLADRLRKMVAAFDKLGVTEDMIEGRLRHKVDVTSEHELIKLRQIYTSIQDNFSGVHEFFDTQPDKPSEKAQSVRDKLAARRGKTPDNPVAPKPPEEPVEEPVVGPEESPFAQDEEPGGDIGRPAVMPKSPEKTAPDAIRFAEGKYAGKTVEEVFKTQKSYITFMSKRAKDAKVRDACLALLAKPKPQEAEVLLARIASIASGIPMESKDLDVLVADGYNGRSLSDLTEEELQAVVTFLGDMAGGE